MLGNIDKFTKGSDDDGVKKRVEGKLVLMKKNVLGFNDFHASLLDGFHELLGHGVSLQLVSAVNCDAGGEFMD